MDPQHIRHLRAVNLSDDPVRDSFHAIDFDDSDRLYRNHDGVEHLIALVGDVHTLRHLDAEPIPDEPFDWSSVEDLDRSFVGQVLELSDRYCDAMLDREYRTITRRLIARVARRDPRPFRRSTNVARAAAGLVWLAGRASGEFGRRGGHTNERLWDWFGVSSAAERGYSFRKAAGLMPDHPFDAFNDDISLGDASLLHSRFRGQLIARRDFWLEYARKRQKVRTSADGRFAEVRAQPTQVAVATKGVVTEGSRAMVVVGLGDDADEAQYFAFSIPDARDLVARLQDALEGPPPRP